MYSTEHLIEQHFQKKPGENLEVLQDRYREISSFHKDPLTAAILATSYYGMEELQMRLPRINEIMRNPFSRDEDLHAVTGLIIAADGGPAEGAKAIQIRMALGEQGIRADESKTCHLIALLAIASRKVLPLMEELLDPSLEEEERKAAFHVAAADWLLAERERQALICNEEDMAYALLVGLKDEVDTILEEK